MKITIISLTLDESQIFSVLPAPSRDLDDIEFGILYLMSFTQVGCSLYMLQIKFASRVKLWRHIWPNSSNKVPFAPKHG
jgi:hypothetical protein